jgi:4,5-dihydroxyphthalate decarboxylase
MARVPLTIVCDNYDRIQALRDGDVKVEGCDVTFVHLPPSSSFPRLMNNHEFQVSEMSLSTYMLARSRRDLPYRAIPVAVSRVFAHCSIWINADGRIRKPQDLKGATVGMPNYHFTRGLSVKGVLKDEYGIGHADMKYCFGGVDSAYDHAYMEFPPPAGVEAKMAERGKSLTELLIEGKIDAIVAARDPDAFLAGHPKVKRLFPDFRAVERASFERSKVWPVMHLIGVRTDMIEKYPWLPLNLMNAFELAKQWAMPRLFELDALTTSLPWLVAEAEDTVKLMGKEFWPYGVEPLRPTLEAQTRWSYEQGISAHKFAPEDLFVESTRKWRPVDAGRR